MGLTLLHVGLAGGAALALIPILLHLFMRQTPRKIIFPALQLLKNRHRRTTKRLRVKNWLLLLTRMALLALMALALARPACNTKASLGDHEVPTAVALVFDTSYSMQYTERGKDRLAEAKQLAIDKLHRIADTSQVYVIDSADPGPQGTLSPSAARKRIEALTLRASNHPLNVAVGQAYLSLSQTDLPRRVVYVLTDLARSAWDIERPAEHLDVSKKVKGGISTFIVKLGAKTVEDVAVVAAEPVTRLGIQGETAAIKVRIHAVGKAAKRVVDLYVDGTKRQQKPVEIAANGEAEITFETPKLDPGAHQGEIVLGGGVDPLKFDDKRFFSFDIQPPLKVLVVTDLVDDAEFVARALDPTDEHKPFQVDSILSTQPSLFAGESLRNYASVYLINLAGLSEAQWSKLNAYVHEGGGIVLAVGDRANPENYNGQIPAQFMPATLKEPTKLAKNTYFAKFDATHPLFSNYSKPLEQALPFVPVFKYWKIEPVEGARTILSYFDGAPALIERGLKGGGSGKVLLWTTPLARRADRTTARDLREGWNDFPLHWPFLVIVNQTIPYLAGRAGKKLVYEAGEDVIIPVDPARRYSNYSVQSPRIDGVKGADASTDRLTPPPNKGALVIVAPQPEGNWSVTASGSGSVATIEKFSINLPESETRFFPLENRDLDGLFGKKNYGVAETLADLKQIETDQWIGKEIYPWLMMIVLALVTGESVLANRFYRVPQTQAATVR